MSSGFISETEIAEQRKLRQEEWEKARSSDQPLDRPDEKYDPRSLYEKLQEQKNKRDLDYEEAHKLKNMIKGLDDDEVEFLDLVDRTKLEEERKKQLEEAKEMRDFKAAVASLHEKSLDERLKLELKNPQSTNKNISSGSGRNSQVRLLAGVVVKKSEKSTAVTSNAPAESKGVKRKLSETSIENEAKPEAENSTEEKEQKETQPTMGMKCIGILPGLGPYDDSSDSDCSSNSEHECENRVNTNSRNNPQKTSAEN